MEPPMGVLIQNNNVIREVQFSANAGYQMMMMNIVYMYEKIIFNILGGLNCIFY